MQVTTALSILFKSRTFQRPNQFLAIDPREFLAHAAAGMERRVINNGSRSKGTLSPSCNILST